MENRFTSSFGSYTLQGDSITAEIDGFMVTATIEHDSDHGAPWEENDGHGVVSDWTDREPTKGELILSSDGRGRSFRYYDTAATLKIALRDGWSSAPHDKGTKRDRAKRAVMADYEYLRAWCNDEWHYVGIVLSVSKNGVVLCETGASLGGLESTDGDGLTEAANELLEEALDNAKAKLKELRAA